MQLIRTVQLIVCTFDSDSLLFSTISLTKDSMHQMFLYMLNYPALSTPCPKEGGASHMQGTLTSARLKLVSTTRTCITSNATVLMNRVLSLNKTPASFP